MMIIVIPHIVTVPTATIDDVPPSPPSTLRLQLHLPLARTIVLRCRIALR